MEFNLFCNHSSYLGALAGHAVKLREQVVVASLGRLVMFYPVEISLQDEL